MKPKSHEIAAGLFVILSIALFLLFIGLSGEGLRQIFSKKVTVVTQFGGISALKKNVQVTYRGDPIGEVTYIKYDQELDRIRVKMEIREDMAHLEGKEAVAIVTQATFLGDQYIEITGDLSQIDRARLNLPETKVTRNNEGELVITSIDPSSIGMLMAQAQDMLGDVKKFTGRLDEYGDQVSRLLASAENAAKGVENITADPKFQSDIKATASNAAAATADVRVATAKLPGAIDEAKEMLASGRRSAGQIESLLKDNRPKIDSMITNADELMMNARVLSYGLAESPWMLVWKDKEWQKRVQARDPKLLNASLRDPAPEASGEPAAASSTGSSSNMVTVGEGAYTGGGYYSFNVAGDR